MLSVILLISALLTTSGHNAFKEPPEWHIDLRVQYGTPYWPLKNFQFLAAIVK